MSALADEYASGHFDPPHRHARAQLIYSTTGVMTVTTAVASYVVPPQRAVWVPAGEVHEVHCRGKVSCRTLYVQPQAAAGLPSACQVLEVSELLRELIVEATRIPIEYDEAGRDGRVIALLLDEIRGSRTAPWHVPMPTDHRLVRVCSAILREPAEPDRLDHWADVAGMGRRTFTRTFRRETSMSFANWRQNVRLMEAMSRLALGEPVTRVALDVGYRSPSAFTAMFRRAFGVAPTHYLAAYSDSDHAQGA